MMGKDDTANDRWCDIVGNFYSTELARNFSYEDTSKKYHPTVRLRINPKAETLSGRIEARGLKPNFCYQLKIKGDHRDMQSFERIGFSGRWRLGEETNWSDYQYRALKDKSKAEAYILFDWLVTDARGNAARDLSLCQSYHVLFPEARSSTAMWTYSPIRYYEIKADNPKAYMDPKVIVERVPICGQCEPGRYPRGKRTMKLEPAVYTGFLALTEESFHSKEADGGRWATVMQVPVRFEIVASGD